MFAMYHPLFMWVLRYFAATEMLNYFNSFSFAFMNGLAGSGTHQMTPSSSNGG